MASTALIGTETAWLTPPKRALNRIDSLVISSRATARSATFSTMRPSLTACNGTCTPERVASTSRCGVMPLSAIHS